ncbi:MAG: biotin--[acetyl-CoA-carboxylase] ligase [Rhodococcus sp.]|nr:biotin--[acetyl-CoA-carboxylase] ligase [Rhodococcus sp. (in: high G+C Gram-positive bacteria)]
MWNDLNRPPLDADALRKALVRGPDCRDPYAFWNQLDVVATTGSTNADLLERAAKTDSDRHVLIAEHQGSARGRNQRSWVSPPRAQIAVSMHVTMPGLTPADMGWLPLLTGVAVVDALREIAQVPAELKWPNDVLVGGKKIAGILAEVAAVTPSPAVVVGVGLNVSLSQDELPIPEATSLTLENAQIADRDIIVRALLRAFASRWEQWQGAQWRVDELAEAYRQCCGTLGARVRAILPGEREFVGTAIDIDEAGRLIVRGDDGEDLAVAAGDITHLRREDGSLG